MATPIARAFVDVQLNQKAFLSGLAGSQAAFTKTTGAMQARAAATSAAITKSFVAATAGLALLGGVVVMGVKSAASYETAWREVWTLMAIGEDQMKSLADATSRMSVAFGQSEEIGLKALYQITSAGFIGAEAMTVLEESLKGAVGGVSDVFTAADILTGALNAWNVATTQSAHVMDLIFTTIKEGKVTMDSLAAGAGRVMAIAGPFGIAMEEAFASLATLTKPLGGVHLAATALVATIRSFLKPQEELNELMEEMGYETGRVLVEEKGLAGAIVAVKDAAAAAGIPLEVLFSNVRAMMGVMPLATTMSEEYARILDSMYDSAGATSGAVEKMMQSFEMQWSIFSKTLGRAKRLFGEAFLPMFTAGLEKMIPYVEKLAEYFRQNGDAVRYFVMHAMKMLGIIVAVGALAKALHLLMSPVGALIAAAALVYGAWYFNLYGIQEMAEQLGETLTKLVVAPLKFVMKLAGADEAADTMETFMASLNKALVGVAAGLGAFVLGTWLVAGLLGKLTGAVLAGSVLTLPTLAVVAALGWDISQTFGDLKEPGGMWPSIAKLASQAIGAITGGILGAAVGHPIMGAALGAYAFGWMYEGLLQINWNIIQSLASDVAESFHDVGTQIYEATGGLVDIRVSDSEGIRAMAQAAEEMAAAFRDYPDTSTMDLKFEWIGNASEDMKDLVEKAQDFKAVLDDMPSFVPGLISPEFGPFIPKQAGGPIPGVGFGDTVPAMLEPGEFVVPTWMMRIPWLASLIGGIWSGGRHFQAGGDVGLATQMAGAGIMPVALMSIAEFTSYIRTLNQDMPAFLKGVTDYLAAHGQARENVVEFTEMLNALFTPLADVSNEFDDLLASTLEQIDAANEEAKASADTADALDTLTERIRALPFGELLTSIPDINKVIADLRTGTAENLGAWIESMADLQNAAAMVSAALEAARWIGASEAVISELEALAAAFGPASDAVETFADRLARIQLGAAGIGIPALLTDMSSALATVLAGGKWEDLAGLLAEMTGMDSVLTQMRESLERITTGDFGTQIQAQAQTLLGALQGMKMGFGETFREQAERLKREAEELAARLAKEAEAAFRAKFEPANIAHIQALARDTDALIAQAAGLRELHDITISDTDVMRMVVGAKQEYYSQLQLEIDITKMAGQTTAELEEELRRAKIALGDFVETLSGAILRLSLTDLGVGIEQLIAGTTGKLAGATTFDEFNKYLSEINAALSLMDTDRLERIFGAKSTWPLEIQNLAQQIWEDLQGIEGSLYKSGETLKETADRLKRDAEEAARKAQEAFRAGFDVPAMEALRTGDWSGAVEAIKIFAQTRGDLTKTASELSKMNDVIIDEAEVLSLITGSYTKLSSNLDSLIAVMEIAGEDTTALDEMRIALEEIIDPLGALKKILRDITGMAREDPTGAGESFRRIFESAMAGVTIEAAWGDIVKELALSGENFAAIHQAAEDVVSGFEQEIAALEYFGFAVGDTQAMLDEFRAAILGVTVEMLHWQEWLEQTEFGAVLERGVSLLPEDWHATIQQFLTSLDPTAFGDVVTRLASYGGEAGETFLRLTKSLSLALVTGDPASWLLLIMDGAELLFNAVKDSAEKMKAMAETVFAYVEEKVAWAFDKIVSAADNLVDSFKALYQQTDTYRRLQSALERVQQIIMNALMGFLMPVVAVLEALIKALLGEVDVIEEETAARQELFEALNIPAGFKGARYEWRAAEPGMPYRPWEEEPVVPTAPELPTWWEELLENFRDLLEPILDLFGQFISILQEAYELIGSLIIEGLLPALRWFGEGLVALAQSILENLVPLLAEFLPGIINDALMFFFGAVVGIATFFVDTLTNLLPNLALFFEQLGIFGGLLPGLFAALSEALSLVFATIIDAFTGILTWVNAVLAPDLKTFFTAFGNWWRTEVDPFLQKKVFPVLGEWMTRFYTILRDKVLPFLENKLWPWLANTAWPIIEKAGNRILGFLERFADWVTAHWPQIEAWLTYKLEQALRNLEVQLEMAGAIVKASLGNTAEAVNDIWRSESLSWWQKIGGTFAAIGATWQNESLSLWQRIGGFFGGLWEGITGFFGSLFSWIPGFQGGGIVYGPTLAMVGEGGPEAIVPLDSFRGLDDLSGGLRTSDITLNLTVKSTLVTDGREIASAVARQEVKQEIIGGRY